MSEYEQTYLSSYLSKCNDWRPTQELLITRFAPTEYFEMFRTINQDCKFNKNFLHLSY